MLPESRLPRRAVLSLAAALLVAPALAQEPKFPDVVGVKVQLRGGDAFDFDVTMTSPYDTAERYADAFRIVGPDGKELGVRVLLHDHKDEQPFTRELTGVRVPAGVRQVTVQGRDQRSGYGGKTMTVALPGR
jgi:hypothetical protein